MYGNLSSYDFFDDNGNKKNINLKKETVKSISWNVLSDNNYNKANQHASRIEKMTKYIEFKDYLKEIKPEIDESIKCLKEKNEKLLVDKPYVDFINISEHIGGYKHQGLAIEMYTRAAQWMGLNKMKLKAGLLNENSSPIWDLKLSQMKDFNYEEKVINIKRNKYKNEEIKIRTIVRYDRKLEKTKKLKL